MKEAIVSQRPVFLFIFSLALVLAPEPARADIQCYNCHGTGNPVDYRPLDATVRNVTTGGFPGNHRTHTPPAATPANCVKCHPGCTTYISNHRDGKIKLSANINASPLQALYKNTTSAFPQTPTPTLGTCTNVNCHFEKATPVWGSPALVYPADCSGTCHGSPPTGGSSGADGSHTSHNAYFPGLSNCAKCHADHTGAAPFAHATSAGGRGVVIKASDPALGPFGTYTGNTRDFLPSQTNKFSVCNNFYCHTTVQGLTDPTQPPVTLFAPTWGGPPFASICGETQGCHGVGFAHPDDANVPSYQARWKPLVSGSHARHIKYRFNEVGNCQACHYNYTKTDSSGCSSCHLIHSSFSNHIEHNIEIAFNPTNALFSEGTGTYSGDSTPGTPYGSCSGLYCHSSGTAVATGVLVPKPPLQWGSGALGCAGCHDYPPTYPNGAPKANSHIPHNRYTCNSCHYSTTTDGATITTSRYHVNRAYNVNAGTGVSFTYSYASTGGTCTNISCHHGGNATWGTILSCDGCHGAPPATVSHLKHYGGTAAQAGYGDIRIAQDFNPDATGYIMNCGNCHPMDASKHANGTVEVELHNPLAPSGSLKGQNPASAVYVNGTSVHTDNRGFAYTNGTCSNVYCHSYNDWTTPGGVTPYTNYSTYWPPNLVITRYYKTVTWGGPPQTCAGCHANPPRTKYPANDKGSGDSHSWINAGGADNAPYVNGVEERHNPNMGYGPMPCKTCHNGTVKVANTWTLYTSNQQLMWNPSDIPISNYSMHVNGGGDVNFDKANPVVYNTYYNGTVIMNLSTAQYNSSRKTCSNVACHKDQKLIKWGVPYDGWSNQCYVCHSY